MDSKLERVSRKRASQGRVLLPAALRALRTLIDTD
jgi:hypothetical protein